MGNARGTCCTCGSTDTGLIGEETSLDSKHNRRSCESSENRLHIKSAAEDLCKHTRKKVDMCHDHKQCNGNIEESHERNNLFRDSCDLFSTAADADEE